MLRRSSRARSGRLTWRAGQKASTASALLPSRFPRQRQRISRASADSAASPLFDRGHDDPAAAFLSGAERREDLPALANSKGSRSRRVDLRVSAETSAATVHRPPWAMTSRVRPMETGCCLKRPMTIRLRKPCLLRGRPRKVHETRSPRPDRGSAPHKDPGGPQSSAWSTTRRRPTERSPPT